MTGETFSERRKAARRVPRADEPLRRLRLRTGRELQVLDICSAGAQVEADWRILPGTHLDVHVMTREGRVLVRSRVTRSCVCSLEPDVVRYRGGLAFDTPVETRPLGYLLPDADPTAGEFESHATRQPVTSLGTSAEPSPESHVSG
jgi:hypothetical protein